MNPAARSAFGLRLEDFSALLPASAVRRFAQVVTSRERGFVKIGIAGAPPLDCSVEILNLADGEGGVIVAELAEGETRQSQSRSSATTAPKRKSKSAPKQPPAKLKPQDAPKPTALTSEEMRAFRAVGRTVLRRCADQKPAPSMAPSPASPRRSALSRENLSRALMDLLGAFDLVLFLNGRLDILEVKGRPVQLGWRKASLSGKSVADFLPSYERAVLRRMLKKLNGGPAQSAASTLVVTGESGSVTGCRAILSRSWDGNAAFVLAFMSLEEPQRLKKLHSVPELRRLAA